MQGILESPVDAVWYIYLTYWATVWNATMVLPAPSKTLFALLLSVYGTLSLTLALPRDQVNFDSSTMQAASTTKTTFACPLHDKVGWGLNPSYLSQSEMTTMPPNSRRIRRSRRREQGQLGFRRAEEDGLDKAEEGGKEGQRWLVDSLEHPSSSSAEDLDVDDLVFCHYPINTSDRTSFCVYSKVHGGRLVKDFNKGSCLESARVVAMNSRKSES
ncbi:hypothetical protein CC2G_000165 [Coprinopsis cinerea AmutBmut pab1-1]|nr:hypothetical protein CC2G_000165 [Coprinopsis cinerea AmutBmut pab1-1]